MEGPSSSPPPQQQQQGGEEEEQSFVSMSDCAASHLQNPTNLVSNPPPYTATATTVRNTNIMHPIVIDNSNSNRMHNVHHDNNDSIHYNTRNVSKSNTNGINNTNHDNNHNNNHSANDFTTLSFQLHDVVAAALGAVQDSEGEDSHRHNLPHNHHEDEDPVIGGSSDENENHDEDAYTSEQAILALHDIAPSILSSQHSNNRNDNHNCGAGTEAGTSVNDDVVSRNSRAAPLAVAMITQKNERQWLEKLEDLRSFYAEHGHCSVPQKYPQNPQLGTWVHKQRTQYANYRRGKASQLSEERMRLLEAAGMDFSTVHISQPKEEGWQNMYLKLVDYQKENGNCFVPKRYKENPQLGEWVCNQRKHHTFLTKGKKSSMTYERAKLLEDLGFVWDASSRCANQRDEDRWNSMYEQLKKYKEETGDALVPTKYSLNPKLGNWVSNERRHFKLLMEGKPTSMTAERKRKLDDIGFVWLAPGSSYSRKHTDSKRPRMVDIPTTSIVDKVASDQTNSILAAPSAPNVPAPSSINGDDYGLNLDEHVDSITMSMDAIVGPILKEEENSVHDPSMHEQPSMHDDEEMCVPHLSIEEAARVAAAVAAGKGQGQDGHISLWVCEQCGKTTFLKLSMCCGKKMIESVVANI